MLKRMVISFILVGSCVGSIVAVSAEDTIPITADTTGWTNIKDVDTTIPITATNYISLNSQDYKVESDMIIEEGIVSLNERNTITNMNTKEVISYTSQSQEQETSKLLYALNDSTTFNDLLCDENTDIYYRVDSNEVGESLKKMYLNTKIGADIVVTTNVTMDGSIVHDIEISNTSQATLENISFMATVDIQMNGSEAITTFANGDNGIYMLSGHINLFGDPIEGISKVYVGEKGIVEENELDTNAFSALDAMIGSQSPELHNASIYYKGAKQDIKAGEMISYSYQEIIYTGELNNNVVVEYVDEKDRALTDIKVLTGSYGETYTTHELEFDEYQLIKVEGGKDGNFTNQQQTVTYRYEKTTNSLGNTNASEITSYVILFGLILGTGLLVYRRTRKNMKI